MYFSVKSCFFLRNKMWLSIQNLERIEWPSVDDILKQWGCWGGKRGRCFMTVYVTLRVSAYP